MSALHKATVNFMDTIAGCVYRGLSNSLAAAIDTGNAQEVYAVMVDAQDCYNRDQISEPQYGDLCDDFQIWERDYHA